MVLNKYTDHIPPNAVYIGRPSKWGNPFPIEKGMTREDVIEQYEDYLIMNIVMGNVTLKELAQLYGKDLVCYCAPLACHGHVLEKHAKIAHDKLSLK